MDRLTPWNLTCSHDAQPTVRGPKLSIGIVAEDVRLGYDAAGMGDRTAYIQILVSGERHLERSRQRLRRRAESGEPGRGGRPRVAPVSAIPGPSAGGPPAPDLA